MGLMIATGDSWADEMDNLPTARMSHDWHQQDTSDCQPHLKIPTLDLGKENQDTWTLCRTEEPEVVSTTPTPPYLP